MSEVVIAGPYELQHLSKKDEKATVAIIDNNQVQWRIYKGVKVMNRDHV